MLATWPNVLALYRVAFCRVLGSVFESKFRLCVEDF